MFTLSVKVNAASPGAGFLKGTIPYEWFTRVNSSNSGTTTPFINAFSGQVNMSKTNENVCRSCCSTGYGVYHGGFSSSDFKVDKTNYTYACKAHTYTVTYECGSGTGTTPSDDSPTYDANFTPANNTCTAPTGYSFAGWSVSGTTSDVKAAGTPFVWQYAEDKTFTAKWSPKTYTVTYNCGTGTGTPPSQGTATYNANFTPASSTCTAPTGHSFAGWTVSGTSDVKTAGTAFKWTYASNKTFTAKWTANTINLSWDKNGHGGTAPTEPATCVYGYTITMPVALTETGWVFNKWTVNGQEFNAGATGVACDETNLGVSANNATARIKAKWSPITYSIVFNGNAENVTGSTATMQGLLYDKSYELTANGFTKPGYKFDGWCDAWNTETGACAVDANNYSDKQVVSNLTTTNNDTITMYATWKLTPYTIVYDTNGGSTVPNGSYNITDTQPDGYVLATTTKTGYTFDGWCVYDSEPDSGDPTLCKTPIHMLEAGTTGNKWAYAKWTAIKYKIIYNTQGGIISGSGVTQQTENQVYIQEYTVESSPILLASPIRDGFLADAWYTNPNFTGELVATITPGTSDEKYHRDISLYARWKKYCDAGYYLPANSEECAECVAGYYCEGGDFFKSSEIQGRKSCSENTQNGYVHSYAKQEKVNSCFAILKLYGNGGKTSGNETYYDFRAYNNEDDNTPSCKQYQENVPMCVSPKEKVRFNYVLNTENAKLLFSRDGYDFDGWCSSSASCAESDKVLDTTKLKGDKSLYAQWKAHEYAITYHDVFVNGESSEPKYRDAPEGYPNKYTIEDTFAFASLAQMRDGNELLWEFGGWFSDENLITGFSGISAGQMTGDKNVYAKWTAKTGSVNFICNPELKETKSGQVGSYIDVYTCGLDENIGWSCSGYPKFTPDYTKVQVPDGTIDCHPGYRINYKGDGITNNVMDKTNVRLVPDTYTSDLEVVFPSKRFMNGYNLRPGYSFTGWFYNSNFTNATTGIARGSSGHKTVWARWSPNDYRVTYDCDSTTAGSETPQSVDIEYDTEFTVAENSCVKTGYTFGGWLVSGTGDIKQPSDKFGWTYPEDKTFTAKWTPNIYTFTLDKNAEGVVSTDATTTIYERYDDGWYTDYTATMAISAPDNLVVAPSLSEYTFGGYYRCPQTTGKAGCEQIITRNGSLVANVKTNIANDGMLYAKWILKLTCPAGQYYNGVTHACELCEKDNYCEGVIHLMGNNDNQNEGIEKCPVAYPNTSETGKTDISDCYATVTFNSNGGSSIVSQTKNYSSSATSGYTIDSLPAPTWTGYTFAAWYQNEQLTDSPITTSTILSGNKTLYAKWELKEYDIKYYVYQELGDWWQDQDLTPDKYDITSGTITLATPETQDGLLFQGWCISDEYPNQDCDTIGKEFTPTADNLGTISSLYAKWVDAPMYNISYVLNGGSGSTTGTYQYGVGLASLPTPTRTHWIFGGWYRNEDLSGDAVESISDTESGDITLYAKWEFNCERGKWLHVGTDENDKMCLYETKPSTPALKILVGNVPYYAYLSERDDNLKTISSTSTKKLHVMTDGTVYNAHDASVE